MYAYDEIKFMRCTSIFNYVYLLVPLIWEEYCLIYFVCAMLWWLTTW